GLVGRLGIGLVGRLGIGLVGFLHRVRFLLLVRFPLGVPVPGGLVGRFVVRDDVRRAARVGQRLPQDTAKDGKQENGGKRHGPAQPRRLAEQRQAKEQRLVDFCLGGGSRLTVRRRGRGARLAAGSALAPFAERVHAASRRRRDQSGL